MIGWPDNTGWSTTSSTSLAAIGVEYLFGVDGANIEDLYDAAHFRDDITAVLAKHEFSAATMADGYSRATARLGVVMATSGGGVAESGSGLGESLASRVPVLALVGQPPTSMDGRGSFQDTSGRNGSLDAAALFSAVSVYCRRVTSRRDIVDRAGRGDRRRLRGGPAVLLLPKDIQQSLVDIAAAGPTSVSAPRRRAIRSRSSGRCAVPADRSRSSPASRWPATMPAPNSSSCARCCGARVATVPDAKDVSGRRAGPRHARGHRRDGPSRRRRRGPRQRVVPAGRDPADGDGARRARRRAGRGPDHLDRRLPPRIVPCTHVHSDDLRKSLSQLAIELCPRRRSDRVSGCPSCIAPELRPPRARRPRRPVPRRDRRTRRRAARRCRHRRRRGQHRRRGHPPPAGSPGRAVRRRARHGRHGVQLRRRHRNGVRAQPAAPW